MSKKSKLNNREKRLQEKRSRKAANKARYAELKRLGINGKSKRFLKKKQRASTVDHPFGNCGNIGCKKCFQDLHNHMVEIRESLRVKPE